MGNTGVNVSHGQTAGFLGARHEPHALHRDPRTGACDLNNIDLPPGLDPTRLHSRREMLTAIDDAQRRLDAAGAGDQPIRQLFARSVRQAFDLDTESADLRDRYRRCTFGQSCLLARRLLERGVRLVTVNMFDTVFDHLTWDCHADGGSLATTLADYRDHLCPMFDSAYSALLDDLHQRGLLNNTLVLAMGEFGRTPQLNPRGDRDHWPGVWSILFAGAGVRGGQVVGSSDSHGAEPRDRPVRPAEVAATVYRLLGVDLGGVVAGSRWPAAAVGRGSANRRIDLAAVGLRQTYPEHVGLCGCRRLYPALARPVDFVAEPAWPHQDRHLGAGDDRWQNLTPPASAKTGLVAPRQPTRCTDTFSAGTATAML
jgi:hypothetical protein